MDVTHDSPPHSLQDSANWRVEILHDTYEVRFPSLRSAELLQSPSLKPGLEQPWKRF